MTMTKVKFLITAMFEAMAKTNDWAKLRFAVTIAFVLAMALNLLFWATFGNILANSYPTKAMILFCFVCIMFLWTWFSLIKYHKDLIKWAKEKENSAEADKEREEMTLKLLSEDE